MAKDSGTIEYPVSTGYRANWKEWEAVREIMQNAIDTGTKVTMKQVGSKLTIRDNGKGFALRNLLIGESNKNGVDSIGKFGEGMKFAMLVLARDGMEMVIQSNNVVIKPRLSKMFDADVLSIDWKKVGTSIKGTKVVIDGVETDWSDNFLSTNLNENLKEKVLVDNPGELFVKGIFVKDIKAVAGYSLNMERENPVTGDVDMELVGNRIAILIKGTKNKDFMNQCIDLLELDTTDAIEARCGHWIRWGMKHPNMWRDLLKERFGRKVCLATTFDAARNAQYKGWHVIQSDIPFAKGILRTDVQCVGAPKIEKERRINKNDVGSAVKSNLTWAVKMVEGAMKAKIKDVQIVEFIEEPSTFGEGMHNKWVKISPKALKSKKSALETVAHEFVHYYYGHSDLSHGFQETFGKVMVEIAMYMSDSGSRTTTKKKTDKADKAIRYEITRKRWSEIYADEDISDSLYSCQMNELAAIGGAFGVAAFGKKRDNLITEIMAEIIAYCDALK